MLTPVHGAPSVVTTMMIGRGGPKRKEGRKTTPPEVTAARRRRTTTSPRTTAPTAAGITPVAVSSAAMKSRISAPPLIGSMIESWQWIEGWWMDDIESLAEKDYIFLVRNIRKLFGMVGDLQKQGGGRPRCNCPRCR